MKKIRIGVMGVYRGTSMINYCVAADNAEIVAICDKWEEGLAIQKEVYKDYPITWYSNFDEFIQHDMDAVVLANYANEHAPFAIKAMKAGKHVFSEVLPVQTMKEAVELVETVETTGMTYAYGENYCYMPAPYEMRRLYREGKLGEFEYGEGEYIHNCESIWPQITYGDPDHWRNYMYATFYCTHSLGPIIHITGLRPVSVTGYEGGKTTRGWRVGRRSGQFGIEMVTLENGGIVKSIHGDLYKNSIWYTVYGSLGRAESAREDIEKEDVRQIYVNTDPADGDYEHPTLEAYRPARAYDDKALSFGHGGSDFYTMWHFVEKLRGNPEADIIDVYEALDMFLPGMFAYRSVLAGGIPMDIPDLRDKSIRDDWRNDTVCTDRNVAGDQWVPPFSKGEPEIAPGVYEHMKARWEQSIRAQDGYVKAAMTQGSTKTEEE